MFDGAIYVTCNHCQAKNRLAVRHLLDGPRCWRCRVPLLGLDVATGRPASLLRGTESQYDMRADRAAR
jgi:hypothetical protein